MVEATVVDLTVLSPSFPNVVNEIQRPHFIDTIETIFQSGTDFVFLEGSQGVGKTVLLSQFSRRYPNNTLSSFISFTSRSTSDPEVIKDVFFEQLIWAIDFRTHTDRTSVSDAMYNIEVSRLSRKAKRERATYYFVIDGLDEFPLDVEQDRIRQILSLLPLGYPNFKFLVSGDGSKLHEYLQGKIAYKTFPLSGFTLDETATYLAEFSLDSTSLGELQILAQRMPGYLASLRRAIGSGAKIENILAGTEGPTDFFSLEWMKTSSDDELQQKVLAVIAHNSRNRTVDEIAAILRVSSKDVIQKVGTLSFIHEGTNGQLSYVTGAFRTFAASRLTRYEDETNNLIIEYLLVAPESVSTLTEIPIFLEKTGRYEELLDYLSYDRFTKLIELTQTLNPLKQQLNLGIGTSIKLGRDRDLLRLSLESTTLEQFERSETWRSEIEARTAFDDFEGACAIAQTLKLNEERFHAFAVIARITRENGGNIRSDVRDQIIALYEELNPKALGERALDIASDLIFSFHDLAIELVEKAADISKSENSLDWSLASLSIAALRAATSQHDDLTMSGSDATERIRSKVHDPKVQNFISTASLLYKRSTARHVISEAERTESTGDRLFLLRQWIRNNRSRPDAAEVVEYAIKLAIATTPYVFNATLLRELALPLPDMPDDGRLGDLIGLFDGQSDTIERIGPTEDFVRLQLLLTRADARISFDRARNRFVELYLKVLYLNDLEVKATCLAWLLGSLSEIDGNQKWETSDDLHSAVKDAFSDSIQSLLDGSANHFEVTKHIIHALARFIPEIGKELALRLNIAARRDRALVELFNSVLKSPIEKIDFGFLRELLDHFDDKTPREHVLSKLCERLEDVDVNYKVDSELLSLINHVTEISSVQEKVIALARAYCFLFAKKCTNDDYLKELLNSAEDTWKRESQGWQKINLGFQLTAIIAKVDRAKSKQLFRKSEELKCQIQMDSGKTAKAYSLSLSLAMRAFDGLLRQTSFDESRFLKLQRLIELIPSPGDQAVLYSDLSLIFRFNSRDTEARRIVDEKVRPKLEQIEDVSFRREIIVSVAPALYMAHSVTAVDLIKELPYSSLDNAIRNICFVIGNKILPDEPFEETAGKGYELTYGEVIDFCKLVELVDSDNLFYSIIEDICCSIRKYRNRISRQQTAYVLTQLKSLIDAKLPNPRYITHEGYKILAEAQVARVGDYRKSDWQKFYERAKLIPNIADNAYTIAYIGDAIPPKEKEFKRDLFNEAFLKVRQIPSLYDRIDRYGVIAELNSERDEDLSRRCLTEAFSITLETNDTELLSRQRRLVDLAFKIDPAFAVSMSAMIEDDPARKPMKHLLNQQIETARLEKRMSESKKEDEITLRDKRNAPEAAWKNLGRLNAGRMITQRPEDLRDWLYAVHQQPFTKAFAVFAWFIQNGVLRSVNVGDASNQLGAVFDATVQNCQLNGLIASRSSESVRTSIEYTVSQRKDGDIVVVPGERKKVMAYLRNWVNSSVVQYLKIADPYFGIDDLELLALISEQNPSCKILILTSRRHNTAIWDEPESAFRNRWKASFDQPPPDAEIVIVGIEPGGASPIHDRWWITENVGLRLGTSFNSVGESKISDISTIDVESASAKEHEIDRYLFRIVREHQNQRVVYKTMSFY